MCLFPRESLGKVTHYCLLFYNKKHKILFCRPWCEPPASPQPSKPSRGVSKLIMNTFHILLKSENEGGKLHFSITIEFLRKNIVCDDASKCPKKCWKKSFFSTKKKIFFFRFAFIISMIESRLYPKPLRGMSNRLVNVLEKV